MLWHPMTLVDCFDSAVLGHLTAVLASGMLVWYLVIAWRWYESLQRASGGGRRVWGWLVIIFIVCAMAGYVALILALWFPKTSVWFRITFLALQNIACPIFWRVARQYKFHLLGAYQAAGEEFVMTAVRFGDMTDQQIAAAARKLSIEYLKRVGE